MQILAVISFILLVVLSIAGFVAGCTRWFRENRYRWIILAICFLICVFNLWMRVYGTDVEFMVVPQFLAVPFDIIWVIPLGTAFFGGAGAMLFAWGCSKRLLIAIPIKIVSIAVFLPGITIFALSFVYASWLYLPPSINPVDLTIDENGICHQTTDHTCGASSSVTLLRTQGIYATEAEMARRAHILPFMYCFSTKPLIRIGGVWIGSLARALVSKTKGRGITVRLARMDWDSLRKLQQPCIISYQRNSIPYHAVTVLKVGEKSVVIGDPGGGRVTMPRDSFLKKWHNGQAIYLEGKKCREPDTSFSLQVVRHSKRGDLLESILVLGEQKEESARPALIGLLDSDDELIRCEAIRALTRLDTPAPIPELIRLMADQEIQVRATAAWGLGMHQASAAVPALLTGLKDNSSMVRRQAAWALGKIRDKRAIGPLAGIAEDPVREVRYQVSLALAKLDSHHAIEPMIEFLRDYRSKTSGPVEVKLRWMKNKSVDGLLLEALKKPENEKAYDEIIEILGLRKSKSAVKPLLEFLESPDLRLVSCAIVALGRIGEKTAVQSLLPIALKGSGKWQMYAIDALGEIGDKAAIPALRKLLEEKEYDYVLNAISALGTIGDASVRADLLPFLQSEYAVVRSRTAVALGRIGDTSDREVLVRLWKEDKDKTVSICSAHALVLMGDQEAFGFLTTATRAKDRATHLPAMKSLCNLRSRASVPLLIDLTRDDKFYIRRMAALTLGGIGDRRAVPCLIAALRAGDTYAHDALCMLTGENLDPEWQDWSRWYSRSQSPETPATLRKSGEEK